MGAGRWDVSGEIDKKAPAIKAGAGIASSLRKQRQRQ
jgi:hypothetical protein